MWLWILGCHSFEALSAGRNIKMFIYIVLCLVAQSYLTLCNPMNFAPLPMGILQARILERDAIPFSRGSSQPRDWTQVSHIAGGFFTIWVIREALIYINLCIYTYTHYVYSFMCLLNGTCVKIWMGNTCNSMADSCQCMTKPTTILYSN